MLSSLLVGSGASVRATTNTLAPAISKTATAAMASRAPELTCLRQANSQNRLASSQHSAPKHPRYAVSIYQNSSAPKEMTRTPKLFNQKILLSPFRKGLDTLEKLAPSSARDSKSTPDSVTAIRKNMQQKLDALPAPAKKLEFLQALEFQLLGPQAEIGSGKVKHTESINQLHYDCYQLLSDHKLSFADLQSIVSEVQQARKGLERTLKPDNAPGNDNTFGTLHLYAEAASQAPWPEPPVPPKLSFEEFKAYVAQTQSQKTHLT